MRRTIAIVSLIAILLAALAPSGSVLIWAAILPLLLFIATFNPVDRRPIVESAPLPTSPFLSNLSSRAPPNF
ncbi:MAG TPA: hypothetical protein VFP71_04490 [Candidatus Angelobacter sp.]|nr:hypothetical protein [Candidatus Angelobacter sp.]